MVPTVKQFEKLLLTPRPALSKTNDLLHQHGGDLSYKIILHAYSLAFCSFYVSHKLFVIKNHTHRSTV